MEGQGRESGVERKGYRHKKMEGKKRSKYESTKVQNPQRKDMLLISEQTDARMLYCFAGGVSSLPLELSEAEQQAT